MRIIALVSHSDPRWQERRARCADQVRAGGRKGLERALPRGDDPVVERSAPKASPAWRARQGPHRALGASAHTARRRTARLASRAASLNLLARQHLGLLLFAALCVSTPACSLFHASEDETPQQKFVEALEHGNSAEAGQIWLGMTPGERADFRRGVGVKPEVSAAQVRSQILRHGEEELKDDHAAGGGQSTQSITVRKDAGLEDLPESPAPAADQQAGSGGVPQAQSP